MLELIISFILGFVIAWKIQEWLGMGTLIKILRDLNISEKELERVLEQMTDELNGKEVKSQAKTNVVMIKIETHNGHLYAFREQDDQFMAQAATAEELIKAIAAKLPDGSTIECDLDKGGAILQKAFETTKTAEH